MRNLCYLSTQPKTTMQPSDLPIIPSLRNEITEEDIKKAFERLAKQYHHDILNAPVKQLNVRLNVPGIAAEERSRLEQELGNENRVVPN